MYRIVNLVNFRLQSFEDFCPIKIQESALQPQESRAALATILGLSITANIKLYHDVGTQTSRWCGQCGLEYPEMVKQLVTNLVICSYIWNYLHIHKIETSYI